MEQLVLTPAAEKARPGPVDPVLAGVAVTLLGFGVAMVFGASSIEATVTYKNPFYFLQRQALFAGAGLMVMLLLAHFDYRRLRRLTYPMLFGVTALLLLLIAVIFLLGWPLEWPAIIFIFLPIFLPVVQGMDVDLLWFSTLVAVNLQTAFLSPPVAMAAYYLEAVAPSWQLGWIYRGMADFMCLQVIGLVIVFMFPQVALWLPNLLFGR